MMPNWVKSDDVRSGRKAKALDGRLRAAQELMVKGCHKFEKHVKNSKMAKLKAPGIKE